MIEKIIVLLILILVTAFFALSEIAVVTLNDKKIKKMSAEGHVGAKKVLKLIENPGDFLATIQVGVTISSFLTSATASQTFFDPLVRFLWFLPLSELVVKGVVTFFITVILSYFTLVFGELVPKKIAMQNAEEVSFRVVGLLLFFSRFFHHFVWFLSISSNFVIKCFGMNPNMNEQTVTEEEILMLVDAGQEKGLIEGKAKNMIANVFDFDNITVDEIMTHRTDITAVGDDASLREVVKIAVEKGFSRIPIFKDSLDKILGIIYVKDLLGFINDPVPEDFNIAKLAREVLFVPNSKKCDELFSEFTSSKVQIAIVVDEYGGTEGIVSMEDLVESIVGNIQDEYDSEEVDIKKTNENDFIVEGSTPIDEIENITNVKIPSGDYDTVAGFITERLGKIPKKGENEIIVVGDVNFKVIEVTDRRISKIRIWRQYDISVENT
ncbi:MAG: HlyC/CorC family transporter [Candidatus Improbicoccus devescovinae]|nr:MAG: HlyC/CorC family transporter [Candidatus Improbicoccus devescovinae]